jgi:Domain of unknown function (DUF3943)
MRAHPRHDAARRHPSTGAASVRLIAGVALVCAAGWSHAAQPEPPTLTAPAAASPAEAAAIARDGADAQPDFWRPAWEIVGFEILLNRTNRYFGTGRDDYKVSAASIRRNLRSGWGTDNDPFQTNQLGHPYQGAMYHGFARSAGLDYWQSLGYAFAGSALWEIAGEQTRPSRNDQVASGIGGTFLGEALFRMSSLVLEKGGGMPRFWRELAAAAIDPAAGFNRLAFGSPSSPVFSSRDAAYFSSLQVGYSGNVQRDVGNSTTDLQRNSAQVGFAIDYGLPGTPGYQYSRPFDYFNFQATASSAGGVENVLTRGLLMGAPYDAGPNYRGVWGVYGSYDYIAPQTFRVSSTAVSLGSTAQWWLGESLSLQGTTLLGLGYAAVSTTRGSADDRDYNYGVAPQALIALRLVHGDKTALDVSAREYFVSNVGSGTNGGRDNIVRLDASLTYRIARQHAVALRVLANRRDARFANPGTQRQSEVAVGIFYTLLGQDRFGTVDWR